MAFTLGSYIESVSNPNGRFKTLEGVYPLMDDEGNVRMTLEGNSITFRVMYEGEEHMLICFLDPGKADDGKLKEISTFSELIDSPFTMPFRYLEDEVLLIDPENKFIYADVILHKVPQGNCLADFLAEFAGSGVDDMPVRELMKGFSNMARWMAENNFSHGRTTPYTIWINRSNRPLLVDYTRASRELPGESVLFAGLIVAALYITGSEPEFLKYSLDFFHDREKDSTRFAALMLDIRDMVANDAPNELQELFDLLAEPPIDRESLLLFCDKIDALTGCGFVPLSPVADMARGYIKYGEGKENDVKSKYSYVGELSDMLMRAFDGRKWCYLDRKGNVVIKGPFMDARDFCEGRAIVETETGFGLIDKEGRYILPPEYGDMDIDYPTNVVIATMEGVSGLFSREGEPITGMIYDQIMNSGDGLFTVKKNKRFGYIRKDGSVLVEMIYEDAFGFRNGIGRVKIRDREYLIDTNGNMVDEVVKKKKEKV